MKLTSVVFASVFLLPIGPVFGQQSGAGAAGQTKNALLVSNGFTWEVGCQDGSVYTGQVAFKEEGDKLKLAAGCDSVVEISGSEVQWTSCRGSVVKVVHYPSNAKEPFKGRVGQFCEYMMKPK